MTVPPALKCSLRPAQDFPITANVLEAGDSAENAAAHGPDGDAV